MLYKSRISEGDIVVIFCRRVLLLRWQLAGLECVLRSGLELLRCRCWSVVGLLFGANAQGHEFRTLLACFQPSANPVLNPADIDRATVIRVLFAVLLIVFEESARVGVVVICHFSLSVVNKFLCVLNASIFGLLLLERHTCLLEDIS